MGVCQSTRVVKARDVSNRIDKQLQVDPKELIQKLLLLGPAESGKSTCVKQMQILHLNGFTNAEFEERKCIIYSNTGAFPNKKFWKIRSFSLKTQLVLVRSMLELLEAKDDLCLEYEDKNMIKYANSIKKHIDNGLEFAHFNMQIKEAIQKLWQDPNIRIAYDKRADYHIHDSASYYFECELNYEDGIAYLRKKFLRLYRNKQKLYIHETCATDTTQLESVFNSVLDTIVQENLQDTGML
uniref:DNK domain-containing protein n=1 Tax=Meloidogyne hapla TaxID=6305 RepID=A0A1I8BPJ0_MELHA